MKDGKTQSIGEPGIQSEGQTASVICNGEKENNFLKEEKES